MRGIRPLVGIPARALNQNIDPWLPRRQGVFNDYIDAVIMAGGIPIMIPLVDDRELLKDYFRVIDSLLLTGGGDISPEFLDGAVEDPGSKLPHQESDILRDKNEFILASWAILEQKPLLGICRGMQVVNVALGGTLYEDLNRDSITQRDHDESATKHDFALPVHEVKIDENSHIASALGTTEIEVNSLHHMGVAKLAEDLRPVAWAPDGVLEAAEGIHHPYLLLTQFHPELLAPKTGKRWQKLFQDFVEHSKRGARSKTTAH